MILRPPKFNAYYDVTDVKPVDGARWHLELSGLIADKRAFAERVVSLRKTQGFEAASALVRGGEGKRVMDAIRVEAAAVQGATETRVARTERVDRARSLALSLLSAGAVFAQSAQDTGSASGNASVSPGNGAPQTSDTATPRTPCRSSPTSTPACTCTRSSRASSTR